MLKRLLAFVLIILAWAPAQAQTKSTAYDIKMNQFIDALIKKMTLDEKIGQLNLLTSDMDVTGPTIREGYRQDIRKGRCGNIFNAYGPEYVRKLQDMAMKTRLNIPLLFGISEQHIGNGITSLNAQEPAFQDGGNVFILPFQRKWPTV